MKVMHYSPQVNGSKLVSSYIFTNGYTAQQWHNDNPYSGACLIVYTPKGFFASDKVKAAALQAINKYKGK